uniref:Calponin-homology (CH) domain-containing protein n=1 Tax=Knipowitschia caucasica TaxID=637954 RepID=A0AAV2K9C5_KNICA
MHYLLSLPISLDSISHRDTTGNKNTTYTNYNGFNVLNFTTSWSDGLAFNAIVHHFRPHAFSWDHVVGMTPIERMDHAFTAAKTHLSIEKLLDPEDVAVQLPDKKSIIMYVTSLFAVLPKDVTMEAIREVETLPRKYKVEAQAGATLNAQREEAPSSPRPETPDTATEPEADLSFSEVDLDTYQTTLEEVLTWLLSAEDAESLSNQPASGVKRPSPQRATPRTARTTPFHVGLHQATPHQATPHHAALHHAVPPHAAPHQAAPSRNAPLHNAPHYAAPHRTTQHRSKEVAPLCDDLLP